MPKIGYQPLTARALVAMSCLWLAACQPSQDKSLLAQPGATPDQIRSLVTNSDLAQAKIHFRNGDFGLAQNYYQRAVAANPKDREALLGLAASYDELRRFDLADKIYDFVGGFYPNDPVVVNNIGYSQLMRGNFALARKYLLHAHELAPTNPIIDQNLALLRDKSRKL